MNTLEFERNRRRPKAANIVPLIDVALFLLIFFMVAGSIEKFEIIPIDVPQAQSGKLLDEGHIVILIGTHDDIVMDDELITLAELTPRLSAQLKANPAKVVTVKADASIPAVKMIAVMDAIKAAGGRNLSLVTQSKGKKPDAP
jgi:biopolymer transport protein ExbD